MANPESLTCEGVLVNIAKIMHKVHDEKDKDFELEASWICSKSNYEHSAVPADLLKEAEEKAKAILDAEEEDD